MSSLHLPIVDAFLAGDEGRMNLIARRTAPSDPLYTYHVAVSSCLDASSSHAYEHMRKALESPPTDPELFLLLLRYAVSLAVKMNKVSEAQRTLRLLKQLDDPRIRRELKIVSTYLAEANFLHGKGEFIKAFECIDEGLQQKIPNGGASWYRLKAKRVLYAGLVGNYAVAERDLAEMETHPDLARTMAVPLTYAKANFCCDCGRYDEGLALLGTVPPEEIEKSRPAYLQSRIELLLLSGRLNEGKALLDMERDSRNKVLGKGVYENLRCIESTTRGDHDAARQHARNAIACSSRSAPLLLIWSMSLLVDVELCARNARVARSILSMIDLDERTPHCTIYWVRLYMLEKNEDKAAFHFRKLLDRGVPEIIEAGLRYACEVRAADVARLWAIAQRKQPAATLAHLEKDNTEPRDDVFLVGSTPGMRAVKTKIAKFAGVDSTVLLTGETGTGKEVVAQALHRRSKHASKLFLAVNCGAISDTLIESELFGHVKGAFTGAASDHHGLFVAAGEGTLFLDEIEAMSSRLQGALLRVLEEGEVRPVGGTRARRVHARVIVASNQSLEAAMKNGTFRADLYYRVARLQIQLPPLRERVDDIPLLVEHFLHGIYGDHSVTVSSDLMLALQRHTWPGNVRELKNAVELIALLAGDAKVLGPGLFTVGITQEKNGAIPAVNSALLPMVAVNAAGTEPLNALKSRKGQYARLQQLRALFKEHNTLIHAEVVRLVGCAAATATRDLELLESEGAIRRIRGIGSNRTSCFVYCAPVAN